jgi:glucokinase
MFAFPVLLGDIGGTNARFALLSGPQGTVELLPRALTAATPSPVEAIAAALAAATGAAPRSAIIAVATRVDSPCIRLTNAHWTVDAAAIGAALGLERVVLVNDYTPVAASAVALSAERGDLVPLGGDPAPAEGARVVLGPGTGLGAGALVPVENRLAILATEAGHIEFGPMHPDEAAFWPHLERIGGGRVSAEAVLSGPGLLRIAGALAGAEGRANPFAAPQDVFEAGRAAGDPVASAALRIFARFLGRFAGDLALTFEAAGGVYIAGGIAPRMIDVLTAGAFRDAFDRKAPHEAWARRVPVYVISHPEPALQGLAVLAADPARFVFRFQEWRAG